MFSELRKQISSNNSLNVGDLLLVEAGTGDFECEDILMSVLTEGFVDSSDTESEMLLEALSIATDDEDEGSNEYLDNIATIVDDTEIEKLVNKIPVNVKDDENIGVADIDEDEELSSATKSIVDPTIEELADELDSDELF